MASLISNTLSSKDIQDFYFYFFIYLIYGDVISFPIVPLIFLTSSYFDAKAFELRLKPGLNKVRSLNMCYHHQLFKKNFVQTLVQSSFSCNMFV